jgi:hypothetical protein
MTARHSLLPLTFALVFQLSASLMGQNPPVTPPNAPSAQPSETQKQSDPQPSGGRVLGVVPEFNVASLKDSKPLSASGKWHLFVKQTFDPFQFVGVALTSGISQAQNQFPEYGQGGLGYAKRYGAGLADSVDGSFWGSFVLPVLLKEDPRYFRLGEGGTMHRVLYAASTTFVTRTDSGHRRFNFSNVLGNIIAGGISNSYYPDSERGVGLTFQRAAVVTGMGAVGGIAEEFLPDIDRKIFHRHKKNPPDSQTSR